MRQLLLNFFVCVTFLPINKAVIADTKNYEFLSISNTGRTIFAESLDWQVDQWERYRTTHAQPRTCAYNLSKVYSRAGISTYQDSKVSGVMNKAKKHIEEVGDGQFVNLPLADKAGIIRGLNSIYNGKIPAGTLVAGCKTQNCSQHIDGGQHLAFVGHITQGKRLWIWHNNWLRKTPRSKYDRYMVSKRNMAQGFERQWMATPWLDLTFQHGRIVEFKTVLPEIDDTDPNQFYISLAVIPEIARELNQGLQLVAENDRTFRHKWLRQNCSTGFERGFPILTLPCNP